MLSQLPQRIKEGRATVCVLGLGRIGLPLGIVFARSGLRTIGVDVDNERVSRVTEGRMPFHYPVMEDWLREALAKGMFNATNQSRESIESSEIVVITVGTPTGFQCQLDYSQLHLAMHEVAQADIKNKALIIRSTAVPGTLMNIVLPHLVTKTGLKPGVNFALAACPERILEGRAHVELYELPEIIGAIDSLSSAIARELFLKIDSRKVILETSPTGAELAKLFTNIYRYVNFALANEFAIWAERYGEDAHEIIRVANEGYPRSNIPRPGFAGGPCLGKYGFLLDNNTTFSSIISVAWKLNEAVPQHVVTSLMNSLGSLYGKRIAVLGLAFKANSDDVRLSPSAKLVETLKAYGAEVLIHDPYVEGTSSLEDVLKNPELVILATNHSNFKDLAATIDRSGCKIIYDVSGIYKPENFTRVEYRRFGRGR
ncbi:nucleotide sugar dehydrogenase [Candidatus Bathyarchaeota archaeon]|nr:nucleotide sugar dehydrogenase [Candidatus Bathyarchaeota archaeon]